VMIQNNIEQIRPDESLLYLTGTQKKENNAYKALQSLDFFDAVSRSASKKLARG
jgi:hypothetical protein